MERNRYKCTYGHRHSAVLREFSFELEKYKSCADEARRLLHLTAKPGFEYLWNLWMLTPEGDEFVISGMECVLPEGVTA